MKKIKKLCLTDIQLLTPDEQKNLLGGGGRKYWTFVGERKPYDHESECRRLNLCKYDGDQALEMKILYYEKEEWVITGYIPHLEEVTVTKMVRMTRKSTYRVTKNRSYHDWTQWKETDNYYHWND